MGCKSDEPFVRNKAAPGSPPPSSLEHFEPRGSEEAVQQGHGEALPKRPEEWGIDDDDQVVCVYGETGAGKSCLLNDVIGQEIFVVREPASITSCTAFPILARTCCDADEEQFEVRIFLYSVEAWSRKLTQNLAILVGKDQEDEECRKSTEFAMKELVAVYSRGGCNPKPAIEKLKGVFRSAGAIEETSDEVLGLLEHNHCIVFHCDTAEESLSKIGERVVLLDMPGIDDEYMGTTTEVVNLANRADEVFMVIPFGCNYATNKKLSHWLKNGARFVNRMTFIGTKLDGIQVRGRKTVSRVKTIEEEIAKWKASLSDYITKLTRHEPEDIIATSSQWSQDQTEYTVLSGMKNCFLAVLVFLAVVASATPRYFAHVTDIHLDNSYALGPFGAPMCDAPRALVYEAMRALHDLYPSPDFIVYTGDSSSHMVLSEFDSRIIEASKDIFGAFDKYFPDSIVLPVMGNHDVYPLYNVSAFGNLSLLDDLNAIWSKWLSGAFYQIKVAERVRVLALNVNYYAKQNLLSDLREEFNEWYSGLVAQYSDVVRGQFAGHTHLDELRIVRDPETLRAVGHVYVVPSLTPYSGGSKRGVWPAVRVWHYEPSTGELFDYEQLHVNMTAATYEESPEVVLVRGYSARSAWGLRNLSTESWESLLGTSVATRNVRRYLRLRMANPDAPEQSCDPDCVRSRVCAINYSTTEGRKLCLKGRL
eukprot:m51a1_g931 hypothetical protein (705) ;mRNA; r:213753-221584